jgi:hypothetical protein
LHPQPSAPTRLGEWTLQCLVSPFVDVTAATWRFRQPRAPPLCTSGRRGALHAAPLPGLLALPTEHAVDVVAIALDRESADGERFLSELDASKVFLADGSEVQRALGVRNLPVTSLLYNGNRIALRFDRARAHVNRNTLRL